MNGKFVIPKCNLCGSLKKRLLFVSPTNQTIRKNRFSTTSQAAVGEKVVQCKKCGLVYVSPRVTNSFISKQYKENIERKYLLDSKARELSFEKVLIKLKKYKKQGDLLDVGCGAGLFLKVAKLDGFDSQGIEPNSFLAAWGKRHLK